jgi:hypothetical protein
MFSALLGYVAVCSVGTSGRGRHLRTLLRPENPRWLPSLSQHPILTLKTDYNIKVIFFILDYYVSQLVFTHARNFIWHWGAR